MYFKLSATRRIAEISCSRNYILQIMVYKSLFSSLETRRVKHIVLLYLNLSTLINIEIEVLKQLHRKYFLKINIY